MLFNDRIKLRGHVSLTLREGDKTLWTMDGENIVTSAGEELIANLISGIDVPPGYIACGDSNTAATLADTTLQGTEIEREAASISVVGNILTLTTTLTGTGLDELIGEFGVFNAAVDGVMLARWITPLFTLPASAVLDVSWKLTIGD